MAVEVGDGAVDIVVELRELVHVFPYALVGGVEDVRTVLVHVDAVDLLGVDVARDVLALVDDQAALARLLRLVGKHRARQTGADNKVIVLGHLILHNNSNALRLS